MKKLPSVRVVIMTVIAIILVNIIFSFDFNEKQIKGDSTKFDTNPVAYVSEEYYAFDTISMATIRQDLIDTMSKEVVESEEPEEVVDYSEVYPEIVFAQH